MVSPPPHNPRLRLAHRFPVTEIKERFTTPDRAYFGVLRASPTAAEAEPQLRAFGFNVDYVEDRPDRRFARSGSATCASSTNVPQSGI